MKQHVYRRMGDGYGVSGTSAGISTQTSAAVAQQAQALAAFSGMLAERSLAPVIYKQYCTGGHIVMSRDCVDPRGERGSVLSHSLIAEDKGEIRALARAYPLATEYMDRAIESGAAFERRLDELSIGEISGGDKYRECEAAVRECLDANPGFLEKFIDALIHVSSKTPVFIVVYLPDMAGDKLTRVGREIMEFFLACLPLSLVYQLGYMSFAVNCSNNSLYKVRFTRPGMMAMESNVKPFMFLFDIPGGIVENPQGYDDRQPSSLAVRLASAIRGGHRGEIASIREELDDERYINRQDVRSELELHEYVVSGIGRPDVDALISWHSDVVFAGDFSVGRSDSYTDKFWARLKAAVVQNCFAAQNAGRLLPAAIELHKRFPEESGEYLDFYAGLLAKLSLPEPAGGVAREDYEGFVAALERRLAADERELMAYAERLLGRMKFGREYIVKFLSIMSAAPGSASLAEGMNKLAKQAIDRAYREESIGYLMSETGRWREMLQSNPALTAQLKRSIEVSLAPRFSAEPSALELPPEQISEIVAILRPIYKRRPTLAALYQHYYFIKLLGEVSSIGDVNRLLGRYFRLIYDDSAAFEYLRRAVADKFRLMSGADELSMDADLMIAFGVMKCAYLESGGVIIDVAAIYDSLNDDGDSRHVWMNMRAHASATVAGKREPLLDMQFYNMIARYGKGREVFALGGGGESADRQSEPEERPARRFGLSRQTLYLCALAVFGAGFLASLISILVMVL